MIKHLGFLFFSSVILIASGYYSSGYTLEENYQIKFSTGKAEGNFTGLKGTVAFNPYRPQDSEMNVSVEVSTIKTGNTKKDSHAIGDSWFDAEKYPEIKFISKTISRAGTGFKVTGYFTIKDVTKEETIYFTRDKTNDLYFLNGLFTVNRKSYNINGNFFGFAVGKEVSVSLSVPENFSSE